YRISPKRYCATAKNVVAPLIALRALFSEIEAFFCYSLIPFWGILGFAPLIALRETATFSESCCRQKPGGITKFSFLPAGRARWRVRVAKGFWLRAFQPPKRARVFR